MLPIYNKPMIVYLIEKLIEAGATRILSIFHSSTVGLYDEILKRQPFNNRLQLMADSRLLGPAKTLELAERWVNEDDFVLTFGDSVFFEPLPRLDTKTAPHMFVMKMDYTEDNLSKYGQVKVFNGRVMKKKDKPKVIFSDIIQATIWILPFNIFNEVKKYKVAILEPMNFRISALIDRLIEKNPIDCTFLPPNSYLDCGDFEALFKANQKMREKVFSQKKH